MKFLLLILAFIALAFPSQAVSYQVPDSDYMKDSLTLPSTDETKYLLLNPQGLEKGSIMISSCYQKGE